MMLAKHLSVYLFNRKANVIEEYRLFEFRAYIKGHFFAVSLCFESRPV